MSVASIIIGYAALIATVGPAGVLLILLHFLIMALAVNRKKAP